MPLIVVTIIIQSICGIIKMHEIISYSVAFVILIFSELWWALSAILGHTVIKEKSVIQRTFLIKTEIVQISEICECRIRSVKAYNISSALVIGDTYGNEIWINPGAYERKGLKTLVDTLGFPEAIKIKGNVSNK